MSPDHYTETDELMAASLIKQPLSTSREQLRALMDSMPADVTLKDAGGRFLIVNKSMAIERDWPERSIIGKTAKDLYPKDVADDILRQESEVLRTGRTIEREFQLSSKDGDTRVYSTTKFPIFDRNGLARTVGTTSTDITDRKHVEDALRELSRTLEEYRARVAGELELARETQMTLLPSASVIEQVSARYGLCISSRFEPCTELGGDLWILRALSRDRVALAIADFCGHGVNAALNTFRLHALMNRDEADLDNPATFLAQLNRSLASVLPSGQFATLFYGIIDCAVDCLSYAAAASTQPILFGPDSRALRLLDGSGLPLGPFEDAMFENRHVAFPPGSSLLLYSDALTESVLTNGGRLGEDGLLGLCRRCLDSGPRHDFLDNLLHRFNCRVAGPAKDDLTAVFVTRSRDARFEVKIPAP